MILFCLNSSEEPLGDPTFSIDEKNTTTKYLNFKVFIFQSFGPYQTNELRRFNK